MSWSVATKGTKEEVKAKFTAEMDRCGDMYKPGTLEGDDVVAVKARGLTLIDALVLDGSGYTGCEVKAFGSHSSAGDGKIVAASFSLAVTPTKD